MNKYIQTIVKERLEKLIDQHPEETSVVGELLQLKALLNDLEAENLQGTKIDKQKIEDEVYSIISAVPQRNYIRDEDLHSWVSHVMEHMPEKAIFLAKRLGTIGGSEIGVFVQAKRNREYESVSDYGFSHVSDHQLIEEKLLRRLPEIENDNFTRGNLFEDKAAEAYFMHLSEKYKTVKNRPDIKRKILEAKAIYPWARVQVDDVWFCDGKLILTDYKVPSVQSFNAMMYSEPLTYSCQTTLGKMIAKSIGIEIDLMTVCPLDINKGRVNEIIVEEDQKLEEEIIETGLYYHDLICNGRMPPPNIPKYAVFSKENLPADLIELIHSEGILRQLASTIKTLQEQQAPLLDSGLKKIYAASQFADNYRFNIGTMNLIGSLKKEFDKDAAIDFLIKNGMSDSDAQSAAKRVDKLENTLKKFISDKEQMNLFIKQSFEVSLSQSRDKAGQVFELRSALSSELQSRVSDLIEDIGSTLNEHDNLVNSPEAIFKTQKRQLAKLSKIAAESPIKSVSQNAERILEIRNVSYDIGSPFVDQRIVSKDSEVSKALNEVNNEMPDISQFIRFRS
ncbi:hypothetical protein [Vibrio cholerae]|uniref:hypothetical protein n=1 Tax=Vibrio cholerae TaxID=666 RepID=UPI000E68E044|nr:hypothetical protein [Vibrio cholerae]